jgi:SAM-dependent methyltransferase
MEIHEYETMFDVEDRHWWYVGLRDLIARSIATRTRGDSARSILDAGCGTGSFLEGCRGYRAYGVERSAAAFPFLGRRGLDNAVRADVERMPFPDRTFDLVVSADVLSCIGAPGDVRALREFRRVLKPKGSLLLNLPAYESLRSAHDAAVHTRRRYTRGQLLGLLRDAGLEVAQVSYRNSFLFPVAALIRLTKNLRGPKDVADRSDLGRLPTLVNRTLTLPILLENRLLGLGFAFPFGLSLFCIASRP